MGLKGGMSGIVVPSVGAVQALPSHFQVLGRKQKIMNLMIRIMMLILVLVVGMCNLGLEH